MRNIKFRGKKLDDGEWLFGYYFKYGDTHNIVPDRYSSKPFGYFYVQAQTVSQFTGLTDKNGKEIFEGDIVKHRFKRPWKTEYHESKVYWNQVWFCFYLFDGTSDYRMRDDIEYEVIGNVFESNNPELLTK